MNMSSVVGEKQLEYCLPFRPGARGSLDETVIVSVLGFRPVYRYPYDCGHLIYTVKLCRVLNVKVFVFLYLPKITPLSNYSLQ